jgi:hypothetical protein
MFALRKNSREPDSALVWKVSNDLYTPGFLYISYGTYKLREQKGIRRDR